MNRWIEGFENHPFQKLWAEIRDLANQIKLSDMSTDYIEELTRLKKIIKFIDELIIASAPEMMPRSLWNSFHAPLPNIKTYLDNFVNSNRISNLQSANNCLDDILLSIMPYVLSTEGAAQALGRALKAHSDTVTKQITAINTTATNAIAEAEHYKNEAIKSHAKIAELEKKLLLGDDDNDEESLKAKMERVEGDIDTKAKEIQGYHKKLVVGDKNEKEESIISQINKATKKIFSNAASTEDKRNAIENIFSQLTDFHTIVFGPENEEGKLQGGLNQELITQKAELDSFTEEQEIAYKTLFEKIEGLLPGATTTGLAVAFQNIRQRFSLPIWVYTSLFYLALLAMLGVGSTSIPTFNFFEKDSLVQLQIFYSFLVKLPILAPLIWFAIFVSRQRSEMQRLQQEYAHKETVAKSYEGFRKQIEYLSPEDKAFMQQLLTTAIDAIAFNASTTLDKKHGEKLPIQEVAEAAVDKVLKNTNK